MPAESSYREILLTQGQVALVDANLFDALNAFKWYAKWSKLTRSFYAIRRGRSGGKSCTIAMHRQILNLELYDPRTGDHRNPSLTLDNRIENLRIADRSGQQRNKRKSRNNTSGYKGVTYERGKYRARIRIKGKKLHLGVRDTAEAAHRELYVPAALALHGEFARVA